MAKNRTTKPAPVTPQRKGITLSGGVEIPAWGLKISAQIEMKGEMTNERYEHDGRSDQRAAHGSGNAAGDR